VAHARDSGIDIDRAVTDLLEQRAEPILVHESRVTEQYLAPLRYRNDYELPQKYQLV
jgi:hypothetical protein